MHFYDLDSVIGFGQHQGQTLAQVLDHNPGYLNFCVQVLDHFAVRRADAEEWQQHFPRLAQKMTDAAWAKIDEKESGLDCREREDEQGDNYERYDSYSARDAERDTFDALTDGQEGDYDDFFDRGGNMDSLRDSLGW